MLTNNLIEDYNTIGYCVVKNIIGMESANELLYEYSRVVLEIAKRLDIEVGEKCEVSKIDKITDLIYERSSMAGGFL